MNDYDIFSFMPGDESRVDADKRQFRNALGEYATGVAVAATVAPSGEKVGLTINSFASVSLEPPLILWSLAKISDAVEIFRTSERFSISVLAANQETLALHFAGQAENKFTAVEHRNVTGGVPVLTGCTAYFDCASEASYPGGDHVILVGRVEKFASRGRPALIFHQGRFKSLD